MDPRLVAGCNRPAKLRAEQNVEVVRNGEDGTYRFDGIDRSKRWNWRKSNRSREWTHEVISMGGSSLESSREEFDGRHGEPEREKHDGSRAAFTPKRLCGRGKGQYRTFGHDTQEGRVVWNERCLQRAGNTTRNFRKFLEEQFDDSSIEVREGR